MADDDPPRFVNMRTGEVFDEDAPELRTRVDYGILRRAAAEPLSIVRGRPLWEWKPRIDQLKRDQYLEDALQLAYECADAMEQYTEAMGWEAGAAGWYEIVAVILRKLKDYDTEVRWLERALTIAERGLPELEYRLARARALQARSGLNGGDP